MSKRKNRGIKQNLFLIETKDIDQKSKQYTVMGSTGNVYNVTIKNSPKCSCPDNKYRYRRCKHIYFILIKVMKVKKEEEDKRRFNDNDLEEMFKRIPEITNSLMVDGDIYNKYQNMNQQKITKKSLDDICPICLDDLENGEELDYCKYSCGKSVHSQCFGMWIKARNKKTCVFCRQIWEKNINDYINLIN